MVEAIGPAGADHAEIVGQFADVLVPLGDGEAAFSVTGPGAGAGEERVFGHAHRGVGPLDGGGQWLARVLVDGGLGVERVDVAGATVHEQEDDTPRGRLEMTGPRGERIERCDTWFRRRRAGVLRQQSRECHGAKTPTAPEQGIASAERLFEVAN